MFRGVSVGLAARASAGKSPPEGKRGTSLREEWDEIERLEAEGQAKLDEAESRKWALAKRMSDENEAGKTQKELAREVARNQTTVSRWIRTHRRFGASWATTPMTTFNRAMEEATRSSDPERRQQSIVASKGRRALREEAEAIAPEIAKALEKPEVAQKVKEAMTHKARADLALDFLPEQQEEEPEPERSEEDEKADREWRRQRRKKLGKRAMLTRWFGGGLKAHELLQRLTLPDLDNEDEEYVEAFRSLVIGTLIEVRVECDLIERKLNGESVTQEDRREAVAEARAERELEGVDMDAELRSLLDEGRS